MKNKLIIVLLCLISAIGGFFTAYFPLKADLAWIGMLFNFLICLPIFISLNSLIGWRKALFTFLGLSLLAITVESIAIISCVPYGCFDYSKNIGPRIILSAIYFGEYKIESMLLAPWGLVFAFITMLLGAYGLAAFIINIKSKAVFRVVLALLFLISLDFLVDPLAVRLNLWHYQDNSGWFGVPWSNFYGWLISGTIFLVICEKILKGKTADGLIISFSLITVFWIAVGLTLFLK